MKKILLLALILFPLALNADIKVVDAQGLTRAAKRGHTPSSSIEVVFPNNAKVPETISLVGIDGFVSELLPSKQEGQSVFFSKVSEGSWKIKVDKSVRIKKVKIN